jgi:predicted HD phosphohydrolase
VETVSFSHMVDMTKGDAELIMKAGDEGARELPIRLLETLRDLEKYQGCLKVNRLEHSLQSATHASRDDRDEEYIVAALLHDIGDHLAPYSHGGLVASVLKPFVAPRWCWVIEYHPVFQTYYSAHHIGADRDARLRYKDHPWFDDCVEFCEKYDQNCFDPDFESLPLEFFEPMVHRVCAEPRYIDWIGALREGAADPE